MRVLAPVFAACLMFGPGSGLAHFIVVEHAICAEHGDLIHADESHPSGVSAHAHAVTEFPSLSERAASTPGHAHEHCPVLTQRREQARVAQAGTALLPPPESGVVDDLPCDAPSPCADLLRFAPKTSPPASRA
jgi:hypothetical protein